jgi:uncharacterized protein YhaN
MRIRELNLIRYGKFTDRRVTFPRAERDIHLIVGPNEAGKSTVRSAIGDWLFGIPMRTPLAFLHPMPELRIGGAIEKSAGSQEAASSLAFERSKGNKNTLWSADNKSMPDAALAHWLGGLDASAFNRMYALDHTTLVEGGAGILSASDDLGRMLFQSASGIEHLGRVLQRLQEEADALWAPRKSNSREYYVAHESFEQANDDLKKATLRTRDWKSQHDALIECEQALRSAKHQHAETQLQVSRLQRIRRVQPLLLSLDTAQAVLSQLMAAGSVPLLPEDAADILSEANQALALAQADIQRHQSGISEAQAALDTIHVDHPLLSLATDINDLNERRLQYRAHRTDIIKRQEEIRLEWQRAQEKATGLGWTCPTIDDMTQRVPAQSIRSRLNRLLKNRGSLINQRQSAEDNLSKRQQEVITLKETLLGLGADGVNSKLQAEVEQALKLGDYAAALLEFDTKLLRLQDETDEALSALGKWRLPTDALASMSVPDLAIVQGLLNDQRADQAEEKSLRSAISAKKAECERAKLELEQLVRAFQPVSTEQVTEARGKRDSRWQAIKLAPESLLTAAPEYEVEVSRADTLSDSRLDKLQHEADRQSKAQRLELLWQEHEAMLAELLALTQQMNDRDAQWLSLADASGLPQLPPGLAPHWLEKRRQVLDLVRDQNDLKRQKDARLEAIETARQAVWSALQEESQVDVPDLAECLRAARDQITLAEQAHGQRKTLEKQILEGNAGLVALQNAMDSALESWREWEGSWLDAVKAAGYPETVFADRVEAELEVMDEIDRLLTKIRGIQSERIETMQADLDNFAQSALELSRRLIPDLATEQADEITIELLNRLDDARRAQVEWSERQSALKKSNDGLESATQVTRTVQAQLAPLLVTAGIDDVSSLADAITRSEKRRVIEATIAGDNTGLISSADGLAMDQLRAEVAAQDMGTLLIELEKLNQQAEDILEDVSRLSNQHGALKAAFDGFSGADLAAKAEAQKQEAVARMSEAVEQYLRTHTVASLLKWSMEKFRETKQGPMLAKASAIFRTLTLESFGRLLVDSEGPTPRLFGVRPDGQQVDVTGMSEGSRDQLYLALRLAALELQIDQGFNMPLIADDLFINFDDTRTAAGLQVLGELSRRMQVVFLTHHDHLVPLAKEVLGCELNVVTL